MKAGQTIRLLFLIVLFCVIGSEGRAQSGILDASFNPGTGAEGGFVESTVVQADGKILICGNFTSFAGQPRSYIARLNADGTVDSSFTADVSYWVRFMSLQSDGKIVIGGFFTSVGGQTRNRVARLNSNGTLDATFDPGTGCDGRIVPADPTDPFIFAIGLQADGKIIIGGNFTTYNGVGRSGLARLNSNGSLDTTFSVGSGMNSWVRSLLVQTNGQILVSGWFTTYNNQSYNRMVRLNSNGTADATFNAVFGDQTAVYTMAPQPDGKIVIGGHSINTNAVFRQEIVRLNTNGSYDATFNHGGLGANEKVESVVLQSDGKIVLAGYFNSYNGQSCGPIIRLNADGSFDRTLAQVDNWIWTVALQPDHRVVFCGGFSTVDGQSRSGIARLLGEAAPTILNPRKTGNTFAVSVPTQVGKSYSLQYKTSLSQTGWTSLSPVAGDGTSKTLSDANVSGGQRFYQVMQN